MKVKVESFKVEKGKGKRKKERTAEMTTDHTAQYSRRIHNFIKSF